MVRTFRFGGPLGPGWVPLRVKLFEDEGEAEKPVGDFPSLGGTIPLPISVLALEVLHPLIKDDVDVLDLITDVGKFYALNVFTCDCLDHSRSVFERFRSGRIMRVEKYAFKPRCLGGKHIFRLPEIWAYVFVDEAFKQMVEQHDLKGLLFYKVPQVDENDSAL